MAPKKKFTRVDSSSRFRTVAIRTVWTSAMFGLGFAAGRIAPDNLIERVLPADDAGQGAVVGVEVPVVPREVYTVDNEMTRRRDEARTAAPAAPSTPTQVGETAPSVTGAVEPAPSEPARTEPAPAGIGVAAAPTADAAAEPRVVARVVPVEAPAPAVEEPRPERSEVPPPRPSTTPDPAAAAAEPEAEGPRTVRRTLGAAPGTHPFEIEVLPAGGEAAAQEGRARLVSAGLDAHVVPAADGGFRVVIRGRAAAEEQERQRRLAGRVLGGDL